MHLTDHGLKPRFIQISEKWFKAAMNTGRFHMGDDDPSVNLPTTIIIPVIENLSSEQVGYVLRCKYSKREQYWFMELALRCHRIDDPEGIHKL